jgi:hypothetical protein
MDNNFIGITNLVANSEDLTVMIQSYYDQNYCLSRANPDYYDEEADIYLWDCVEAVAIGDGRELFVVDPQFFITSYVDDFCVASINGDSTTGTGLEAVNCDTAAAADDDRHIWEIRKQGEKRYFEIRSG